MDPLAEVLALLRLENQTFFHRQLVKPWGLAVPAQNEYMPVYIVQGASCYLTLAGTNGSVLVEDGDIICLPQGGSHRWQDDLTSVVEPLVVQPVEEGLYKYAVPVPSALRSAPNVTTTFLFAGGFHVTSGLAQPMRAALGTSIHVRPHQEACQQWVSSVVALLCMETRMGQPGSQTAIARLMDVLFIHLIRERLAQHRQAGQPCNGGFLSVMFDPDLSKAVGLIHQQPEHGWTVAELASVVGLSRTAFATRFSAIAGIPPLSYVRQWRMLKATDLLAHSATPLAEIAEHIGYDSVAAFSSAFKREIGVAPGTYRQQRR